MPYGFRVAFVKIRRGSNMAIFTGAGVAIVTPFKEDESIDYDRLDELIDFHCENGTDSIVICGTSGEAATMTEREHMECVKFTVERTKGRIPVIAGTGSNCTKTAMELSKEAAGYGADGVLVVTPYYNKATQKGMIAHFTQVADAAKIPVADEVKGVCGMLGLEPLYLACEGRLVIFAPKDKAEDIVSALRKCKNSENAAVIGEVTEDNAGRVVMKTEIGSQTLLPQPGGELLPRIC